jgi:glycosyltransferase involved in cell wall biosynthesis
MAQRCIDSIRETTKDVEIVCAVDADSETAVRIGCQVDLLLYATHLRGAAKAWNDCLAECSGDPVVLAADDLIFKEGWLEAALEKLEDGGMVGFNDGHWGEELSTHYLLSRKFICEVLGGVIAWECYGHSFHDAETNERARAVGRYAWAQDAHVEHEHWLFGDRQQDATDSRPLASHGAAEQTFKERKANGFPNDYEAVIRC